MVQVIQSSLPNVARKGKSVGKTQRRDTEIKLKFVNLCQQFTFQKQNRKKKIIIKIREKVTAWLLSTAISQEKLQKIETNKKIVKTRRFCSYWPLIAVISRITKKITKIQNMKNSWKHNGSSATLDFDFTEKNTKIQTK